MRYFKLLFSIFSMIYHAMLALLLAIAYGLVWLIGLVVCVPLLIILFVPIMILGLFGGYKFVTNHLEKLDEDIEQS